MSFPAPGAPWRLALQSSLGKSAIVVLSSEDLREFKAGHRIPVTSRIETALDTIADS
jgi:hypothetical protein